VHKSDFGFVVSWPRRKCRPVESDRRSDRAWRFPTQGWPRERGPYTCCQGQSCSRQSRTVVIPSCSADYEHTFPLHLSKLLQLTSLPT